MSRIWLIWSGVLGALGVAMGAFGAHVLKSLLPLQMMSIFETAVRYHLYHVLALLAVAILIAQYPQHARPLRAAAWLLVAGVVLFSGSLYTLVLTDARWLGAVTPLGGLAWVAAWLLIAYTFRRPLHR